MDEKEVLVDTVFLEKLSYGGKNVEVFKKVLSELGYKPVIHPYIAANELDMYSFFAELVETGSVRVADYSEFLHDDEDWSLYESYFMDIHDELRADLEEAGGKKQLEKLVLPKRQTIFTYRKAGMSLGDVHMILMAFFSGMPVVLTEDTDISILRSIARRKMKSELYTLDIYGIVDLLIMIAKKKETSFQKSELVDIARNVGKRAQQSEIKQIWNNIHQSK